MSTFSRTATLFSTVVLGSMLATTTVSSVNTVVNASETGTTQAATTKKNYALKILQGDKDATSTASQFYLDTISLEKQANGNYYAYLTSNTPVNLGDKPISSEDTQHQVVEMGTTEKNGHNQTVYRLTLTANELASGQPIKTKVHVKLDAMDYDHKYDIRLAIQGFKPETATSSSANTSSASSSVSSNSSESSSVTSSEVSSSSVSSSSSIADSSTTTSVAPSSSSQTSSSNSKSSNNDTSASSVVADDKTKGIDTKSSTVDTKDKSDSSTGSTVNITADQGMSRFLKDTAKIDVKGDQTDITLSLKDASAAKMIPSITLADQKKSVSGQETTFTIPTKDLTPDKNGKLTLKSLTHVSAQGYTHDYPSNITFDVNKLVAQSNLKTGDYKIAVSPDSQMDKFFAKGFNVKVGALTSVVSVTYQVPSMMKMIPSVTFDGQTKSVVNNATTIDFTIPTKDLTPDKNGKVTLASFTSVPMSPSKGYNSNITLDMNPALAGTTSDNNNSASSPSESTATSDKDILQDGTYSINYNVYKSGTTTDSTMKTYMKSPANVTVKNDQATIKFATQNDAMSMMKEFSINGATAKADGDDWVITVPVSALSKTMKSDMTIYVAAIDFTEKPSADIVFDMSSAKKTSSDKDSSSSSSASSSSKDSSNSSSSKVSSSSASSSSQKDSKSDITKDGKYSVNYAIYKSGTKTDSTMKTYMKSPAKIAVKDGKATITFATKNGAMSMMKEFSVNGATAKADGDNWVVTVPVAALSKTMKSKMTIYVPKIKFTEHPSADIVFDMSSVKKIGNNGSGSGDSGAANSSSDKKDPAKTPTPNQGNNGNPNKKPSSVKKININENGHYVLGYHVYKTGTKTPSTMQQYMTSTAVVDVKNGKATINFKTQKDAMSLMRSFTVNGHKAQAKAHGWQVTLPVSALLHTLKSNMTIYVPTIHFTEHPSADIVFDVKNAQTTHKDGGLGPNRQNNQSNGDQSATTNNLGSQSRLGIPNATLHQLTILQGNSNNTSVAAQYFLPTIQLVKNSNGSYTGYVTTHTPTMMGSAPISFMDGSHQVKRVSNIKTGNYYQATYKFSLSANEVKAPIRTKIHVHFTEPLNYNHIYTIRLVIGRALNNASEATQPTTGLPSMSGNMMTMPLNNSVSRGTFGPVATGTFENNDVNAEQQADENTDKQANKKADSNKKATVKSGTNVAKNAKADQKDNSTQRNVLIIAGGIIAAALGYVGVSLLTNFFKKG